jgi:3-methyl-2-oxobutanoate hydroxymethyltransferase
LISERLTIPTIGIGAGAGCDGQVQVFHDVVNLLEDFVPKHSRQYANVGQSIREAISQYKTDVESRAFPTAENAAHVDEELLSSLYGSLRG